ncbi:MAG: secretin N-terminal domain-containing protein [Candidatus Omnitrophota bacterium]
MKKFKTIILYLHLILLLLLLFSVSGDLFAQSEFSRTSEFSELKQDNLISLSFQNTDINQAIKVIGDITGTIIIPHDQLQGTITIVSMEKVKPETIVSVLESALMIRGFTLVKSGNALKVLPVSEIKQTNVDVQVGAGPDFIQEKDVVITQVMPLAHASAIKLKNELQDLIGKYGNILADERTNTIIITDASSNIKRLATIISQIDRALPSPIQVKTFVINYGDSKKIAEILNSLSKEDKEKNYPEFRELGLEDQPLEIYGEIEAYVEEETNSIVVATAPVNFAALGKLINKLDIFPPQAMIEVVLMDVILDDSFKMGVEYGSATSPTVTTEGIKLDLGGQDGHDESIFHSLLGLSTDASTQGFTYRILNSKESTNLLGFILKTQENSKVLSTPRILASNNQESSITVGQEIPIIESSVTDLVNNVTTVNFKYEDVGLALKVTPRISQDGYVNLKVHAELKDLSAQTLYDASIINKREANAKVMVPNGHTVVLGGLMRDNDSIVENKIPVLGDLPLVGDLFKKTQKTVLKTELLVFLTPHVLHSVKDLETITKTSKEKLDQLELVKSTSGLKKAVREVTTKEIVKEQRRKKYEAKAAKRKAYKEKMKRRSPNTPEKQP